MPALTFSHIRITVPDLEKAVEFYTRAFGLYVIMPPSQVVRDDSAIGQMCDDVFGEGWESFRIAHLSAGDGVGFGCQRISALADARPRAPLRFALCGTREDTTPRAHRTTACTG